MEGHSKANIFESEFEFMAEIIMRNLQLKKVQSLRNGTEVSEPYIQHFMQNKIYLFYKLSTLWNSEAIKDIPGTD